MDGRPPSVGVDHNRFFARELTEVVLGGPKDLAGHSNRTLLLVWPSSPLDKDLGNREWDAECLEHYTGDTVIYVGEWQGQTRAANGYGVTSSMKFQTELEQGFHMVERVAIPQWPYQSDDLTVWKRGVDNR